MFTKLVPKQSVRTVYEIDLEQLWNQGKRGIITDLDNTLVGARDPHATPELLKWLDKVRELGFKVIIVSNNYHERVSIFSKPLDIPFIHKAKKPTSIPFHKAMKMIGTTADETIMIGDQMMTDVLGGNRLGLYTILVNPIAPKDEGVFTKVVNRNLEKIALRFMKK
ncbi:YqeG family HAD IIIA-type phosphatase [Paenibacillus sp. N1-5-1-14]|uniref:YqeG family HAD IIIA-type phosphatase n=1 Tax=Paenibacillus radicibacter TaxID=2972488 RepID=UPI00215921B7|nr:YqeG family HAD IIIA-type phosphatase [Paenibacillus radicibacter]MCR8645737.1 YqeG family HAD IIIA-type phosphatase [Paenibacillus radicibacter]